MGREHTLEIKFTEKRPDGQGLTDLLTVGEWLALQDGDVRTMVAVMARFAYYDGALLAEDQAKEKIMGLPMAAFKNVIQEMQTLVLDSAAPEASGGDSATP